MAQGEKILPVSIETQMQDAYIDYAMSVIVSRALPDVRDGLKPVHRRVLYGMLDLGLAPNRPYKKSARIVGEVLGKYHPHGDAAVYDSLVRMVQDFSLRYPLVDGQGNFGSVDGDSPAAMRYTEARLKRIAETLLEDLNKNTVDFRPNFDDSLQEPTVMPSMIPNLLINGSSGIAVGMATNIAPHNLSEVVDGIVAYIDDKEITIEKLIKHVKAPDFPTGGIIYGYDGVKEGFMTGRGRVVVRAKSIVEETKSGRQRIIVTEIPYMVNKSSMIENIAELMGEKKIDGISDIRDESDRDGMRIVFDLKRDADANVVLNNLYKHSALQESFSVNNVALVKGRPQLLNLKDMIHHFVDHRHEVVIRRTKWELDEAEKSAHILEGLLIALDNLDEVIELIKKSKDPETAKDGLMKKFKLTEIQAKAILDLRLQRLTGLERQKIQDEYKELIKQIEHLKSILENEKLRMQIIKDELAEVKKKYGDERRTEIVYDAKDFSIEDMIANEEMVITISHNGYIKRTAVSGFRRQGRGGVGSSGATTREEDFIEHIFVAATHNYMLFFTEKGRCYWLKVYEIPEGSKTAKGRPIQNLIQIEKDDKVKAFINVKTLEEEEYVNNNHIVMCTRKGTIKKTKLDAYSNPRVNGIIAINIKQGDELMEALLTDGSNEIVIGKKSGDAIRFNEKTVRDMGRTATGVRGVRLEDEKDEVIAMLGVKRKDASVLVVSEKGYGKRSSIEDYRLTGRSGKGVTTLKITDKTGKLVAMKEVVDTDDLMIITTSGTTIRMPMKSIREMGRNTQGVRLIKLQESDEIAAVAKVESEPDAAKTLPAGENGKTDKNSEQ